MESDKPLPELGLEFDGNEGVEISDALPSENCLACGHPKFFHCGEGGGCAAKADKTNSFATVPGTDCWCRSFTDDPKQSSSEILAHGDSAALLRGTSEALGLEHPESAQRLLSRYIQMTPEGELNRARMDDATRRIAELSGFPTNRNKKTTPGDRAAFIGELIAELHTIRRLVQDENEDLALLDQKYPNYRVFQICKAKPAAWEYLRRLPYGPFVNHIAFDLASAHFGKARATMQTDYKRHKLKARITPPQNGSK